MRRFFLLLGALGALAGTASAHEVPIYPVNVTLTVDSGQLTASVDMESTYLSDVVLVDLLLKPLPATQWPDAITERAKKYIEPCLVLRLNGQPLVASTFEPRYVQEPLRPADARFVFTLRYPLKNVQGTLTGRAVFFGEYHKAAHNENEKPEGELDQFKTYLAVVGKQTVHFELPIEKPDFEISLDGMERPASAQTWERAQRIVYRIASSAWFWIAMIFIIVQAVNRWQKKRKLRS